MTICQACGNTRIATLVAKCSDRCAFAVGDRCRSDYVPNDMGIGGGSTVDFRYCLACGQIQGQWPISEAAIEQVFEEV